LPIKNFFDKENSSKSQILFKKTHFQYCFLSEYYITQRRDLQKLLYKATLRGEIYLCNLIRKDDNYL